MEESISISSKFTYKVNTYKTITYVYVITVLERIPTQIIDF